MVRLVLFDIDGTLVHTGGAGTAAFTKTFATEFNLHHGTEKMRFAGRTDVSLVREFFKIHGLNETPEHFRQFFDRYVFWLDHIVAQSGGDACRGVFEFIRDLQALPQPPRLGLLTGNIQLGAEIKLRRFGLWDYFELGGFADDNEDRNHIAETAFKRAQRVLGKNLQPQEVWSLATRLLTFAAASLLAPKCWPWPLGDQIWKNSNNTRPTGRLPI
jgi:phosphoglycolate phosphatase